MVFNQKIKTLFFQQRKKQTMRHLLSFKKNKNGANDFKN
jgi:hypothetical protein